MSRGRKHSTFAAAARSEDRMLAALRSRGAIHEPRVEVEQRVGSGRGRVSRVITPGRGIQEQHGLRGVVAPDSGKLRFVRECRHHMRQGAQYADDSVQQRNGHLSKAWWPLEQL